MEEIEIEDIEKNIKNTQVLVFAGGRAKRMGSPDTPKALLELNGKPLIDYCIEQYKKCGFTEFVLLLGFLHDKIEKHVGDGSKYGVKVRYSIEPETGVGRDMAFKLALDSKKIDRSKRSLVCFPDDIILDSKFPIRLLMQHTYGIEMFGSKATVVFVTGTEYPYGVAKIDKDGNVISFEEKPFIPEVTSTGVYMVEPDVYNIIDEKIDARSNIFMDHVMERDILPGLAAKGRVYSLIMPPGCWVSINTQKDYENAEKILSRANNKQNH